MTGSIAAADDEDLELEAAETRFRALRSVRETRAALRRGNFSAALASAAQTQLLLEGIIVSGASGVTQ